jgi:hypothetical protein
VQYTMCVVLPSGLPGGPIVLEGFVGILFRSEPGSSQEVGRERESTNKWFFYQRELHGIE